MVIVWGSNEDAINIFKVPLQGIIVMMHRNTRETGKIGETYAACYLRSQGYEIMRQNFHARYGEIDIICLCPQKKFLVFAEVKTRNFRTFDSAETSISVRKFRRLCIAAEIFQKRFECERYQPRLDLIFVQLGVGAVVQSVQHFMSISNESST